VYFDVIFLLDDILTYLVVSRIY